MALIPVSFDLGETKEDVQRFFQSNGYTWQGYIGDAKIFTDYRILIRDTKVAVDRNGIITFKGGYGEIGHDAWERLFQQLMSR